MPVRARLSVEKVTHLRKILPEDQIVSEHVPRCLKLFEVEDEAYQFRSGSNWVAKSQDKYGIYSASEGYHSIFSYDYDEIVAYKKENNGSLEGFDPTYKEPSGIFINWIPIDIDSGPDGANKSIHSAYEFFRYCSLNNIPYKLFVSGFKGIHIYIPESCFSYPTEYKNYGHEVALSAAQFLSNKFNFEFDDSIYNISSFIRAPYSLNEKSGTIKLMVDIDFDKYDKEKNYKEFCSPVFLNTSEVKFLNTELNTPQETAKYFEISPIKRTVHIAHKNEITDPGKWRFSSSFDSCVIAMLNDRKPKERHNALMRIMSNFYLAGLPAKMAAGILIDWVSKLEPQPGKEPYDRNTVLMHMKSWGKFTYSCLDSFRLSYCNKYCKKFVNMERSNMVHDSSSYVTSYQKHLSRDKSKDIDLSIIVPGLNIQVVPEEGHIIGIVAASGVGKTNLLSQIMLGLQEPVLFFSYEMSRLSLLKLFCKQLGMDPNNPDYEALKVFTSHIWIEDSGLITPDEHIQFARSIEQKENIKFKMIGVDFIQNVPVKDPNNPKRVIIDETQAMNMVTKVAKTNSKELKVVYCYLSQVPKDVSAGNLPLRLTDAKGSQALQAICDVGICQWRPHMIVERPDTNIDTDDVTTVFVDKDRVNGWEKKYIDYNFSRQTLLLNEFYTGKVTDINKKTKEAVWERN